LSQLAAYIELAWTNRVDGPWVIAWPGVWDCPEMHGKHKSIALSFSVVDLLHGAVGRWAGKDRLRAAHKHSRDRRFHQHGGMGRGFHGVGAGGWRSRFALNRAGERPEM
jgi:hypothetical protein